MKPKKPKSGSRSVKAKTPDALEVLRGDFDQLLERMNTPAARAAVDALFKATGAEIGKIAQEAARDASGRGIERLRAAVMADPIARAAYENRRKRTGRNVKAAQLRKYMQDLARVYAVVDSMTGNNGLVMFLLRSVPIKALGNKTADALIQDGRADAVIAYLESIAGGAAG